MQSGLNKSSILPSILLIILLGGNLYFSVQYIQNLKQQDQAAKTASTQVNTRLQIATFLKEFIDKVLTTQGSISFDDRVKLESDIRQINDATLLNAWEDFVNSKDSKTAQQAAVKLMSLLADKML